MRSAPAGNLSRAMSTICSREIRAPERARSAGRMRSVSLHAGDVTHMAFAHASCLARCHCTGPACRRWLLDTKVV